MLCFAPRNLFSWRISCAVSDCPLPPHTFLRLFTTRTLTCFIQKLPSEEDPGAKYQRKIAREAQRRAWQVCKEQVGRKVRDTEESKDKGQGTTAGRTGRRRERWLKMVGTDGGGQAGKLRGLNGG